MPAFIISKSYAAAAASGVARFRSLVVLYLLIIWYAIMYICYIAQPGIVSVKELPGSFRAGRMGGIIQECNIAKHIS